MYTAIRFCINYEVKAVIPFENQQKDFVLMMLLLYILMGISATYVSDNHSQ